MKIKTKLATHHSRLEELVDARSSELSKVNEELQNKITEYKRIEEKLRESEEYYRQLINISPEGITSTDQQGRLTFVSPKIYDIFGIPQEVSLIGTSVLEWIHPEHQDIAIDRIRKLIAQEISPSHFKYKLLKYDRTPFWGEMSSTPLIDAHGQIKGLMTIIRDITERTSMEEALITSEEEARRLAQENEIMARIGRIITSTLNIEETFEQFTEEVKKLIPFDRIVINSINIENGILKNLYIAGKGIMDREVGKVYPLKGSGNAEIVRTKSTLLIQTEEFDEYKDRFPMLLSTFQSGFRSIMNVPLFLKGQIIGGLLLRSLKPYAYTEKDVMLAERVGNQIAGAITLAQLFAEQKRTEEALIRSEKEAKRLSHENAIIAEIGRIISSTLNIDEVYDHFAEELRKLIPFDRVSVATINLEAQIVTMAYTWGVEVDSRHRGDVFPIAHTIYEELMANRSGICIQVESENELVKTYPHLLNSFRVGFRSMISVPLISKDEVIGALHFRSLKPNAYSELDLSLSERVGYQIAGAIANAKLFNERKRAEEEKERSILQLQKALTEVKELSGLLPICASCKKIRDDKGYWTQIEAYIRDHSKAEFTHGICPECMKKLYPDIDI